jgi:hypothetical protein
VFADVNTQILQGIPLPSSHKKTLFRELFATRRNGRMAPFLKGVLVALAILSAAVLVALVLVALTGGLSQR